MNIRALVEEMNYYSPPPGQQVWPSSLSQPPQNRFIYVKQNFTAPPTSSKVLVNPHFRKKVYVNPQFNPPKVHVNPTIIHVKPAAAEPPKAIINTRNKLVRVSSERPKKPDVPAAIIKTRNKIVRIPGEQSIKRKTEANSVPKRQSLVSKFKIVRTCPTPKRTTILNITKYKLVKVNPSSDKSPKKTVKRRLVFVNKLLAVSSTPSKNRILKRTRKVRTGSLINISGILYKKSPNSLKKAGSAKVVAQSGNSRYKIIRKVVTRPVRNSESLKSVVKKYKLIRCKRNVQKLKKCNTPCQIYRRTGKCKGHDLGKCNRVHNPDQIVLCTRFLQGACTKEKCLLSHKVSPEKMPTCKFFLEATCSRDNCPYIHVKINPKAEICRDFLAGFCARGAECNKRHQLLCPDYEKTKSCPRKRCPYPHGEAVRKAKSPTTMVAKKCSLSVRTAKTSPKVTEDCQGQRYYEEKDPSDRVVSDERNCLGNGKDRPKLGTLPVFIPFS